MSPKPTYLAYFPWHFFVVFIAPTTLAHSSRAADIEHVTIYREAGRFGGWPANFGAWIWNNEILVGFDRGYYKDLGPARHAIDREKPEESLLARSLDGGHTWTLEYPNKKGILLGQPGALHGTPVPGIKEKDPFDCPGQIDFTHPDFAMTLRMTDIDAGPSRFYTSTDRGHNWAGPYKLPLFGQPGIAARTDYIVNGKHDCMAFVTASKSNGQEGRPIAIRTTDGGKTWKFLSFIGPEPEGFSIMPSTVRLSETHLLTALRRREGPKRWIETYVSHDNGQSWTFNNRPIDSAGEGNPPAMILLKDGRVCLTYGYRADPYSIRAKLSNDQGKTWSDDIMLRTDGDNRDLGYPRTLQRPDGKIVTMYYFNDHKDPYRYVAATIWDPPPP
jgi:photosystem II stability/assembly factor-like uncharacterized protein